MSVNPFEENLRRLRVIKSITRKEIDTTNDLKKKEVLRKRYERISQELEDILIFHKII